MKRVHCLYRVSTKKQLDKTVVVDDIPLQQNACKEFAARNNWVITGEFSEKGVSGFKVSANKRDAIQDLKMAAEKGQFDILLVYMKDRIGRIYDETPFIVEWFVKHGIEIWSVTEGQQRFENHTDNLINYIYFWQASGESQKTSIRVKDALNQLTEKGVYTGGVTPFGYKTVPSGRFNKQGKELVDLEIDSSEAPIVRLIFEKSVNEGYGSHRLASLLNEMGIKTHNGSIFQSNTVNRILKNRTYCGYYVSGDILSPHLPHLQIIDEEIYEQAQYIIKQRMLKTEEKAQMALSTKGKTLISGNLFCAHCGSRMVTSGYKDSYTRADGSKVVIQKQRYMCTKRVHNRGICDGQSVYTSTRIDGAVDTIVREYLSRITTTAKSVALEKRYENEIAEMKLEKRDAEREYRMCEERLSQLSSEIAKSLTGESSFTPDVLATAIDNTKAELKKYDDRLVQLNYALNNTQGAMKKLDFYYDQFRGWSEVYDESSLEQRKMIICQLIKEINLSRGYEIDIVMDISYEQFLAA